LKSLGAKTTKAIGVDFDDLNDRDSKQLE